MDQGFLGEKESEEQVTPMLVARDRRPRMTRAMLVPKRRNGIFLDCKESSKVHRRAWAHSGATTSQRLRHWRGTSHKGESQSNGIIESAVGLVAGQARTLKAALGHRIWTRIPPDARILCWLLEFGAYLMNRCDIGSDGKTPLQRLHGRKDNTPIVEFGEDFVHAGQARKRRKVGTASPS